jgi:hypothetical protein
LNEIEPNFNYTSAEAVEAVKLRKTFELINLANIFEKQISFKKPEIFNKKRFQLAEDS